MRPYHRGGIAGGIQWRHSFPQSPSSRDYLYSVVIAPDQYDSMVPPHTRRSSPSGSRSAWGPSYYRGTGGYPPIPSPIANGRGYRKRAALVI